MPSNVFGSQDMRRQEVALVRWQDTLELKLASLTLQSKTLPSPDIAPEGAVSQMGPNRWNRDIQSHVGVQSQAKHGRRVWR